MPTPSNKPRKRWGQHFLRDTTVIGQIIAAIRPGPDDTLVEIGPGDGALTVALLERAGPIHAIEIDRNLATKLQQRFGPELKLHVEDVLNFDFNQIETDKKLTVVGNLPYDISTPILFHLIDSIDHVKSMYFMLQLEVAERLVALPGTKNYSRLSVMLACLAKTQLLFQISPDAFYPPPKVTSALVRILPQPNPLLATADQRKNLEQIVRQAFTHRRKILAKAYPGVLDIEMLSKLGINPTARPETLTPKNFIDMLKYLDYDR